MDLKKQDTEDAIGVVTKLLKNKVDGYELYLSNSTSSSIEARAGEVDAFNVSANKGMGLRIVNSKRPGFAFSTNFTKDSLEEMVNRALSSSNAVEVDDTYAINVLKSDFDEDDKSKELNLVDSTFSKITEDKCRDIAFEIEKAVMDYDSKIKTVRKASFSKSMGEARIVNSNGVDVHTTGTYFSGSVMAVAEEGGDSQMGWDAKMSRFISDIDGKSIGNEAGRRAVSILNATPAPTMKCAAVLENLVVMEFLSTLASSFMGDNVFKGKSMLKGKVDKMVFSEKLNITDNGLLYNGWGSSPFDSEGMRSHNTVLVANGIVKNFLYDSYWARRAEACSTGNAVRGGIKDAIGIGTSNLYIEKGSSSFEDLVGSIDKGVLITDVMGVHTVDPISGDFSLGASGFDIEEGQIKGPLNAMAIAGNLMDMFSSIEAVGSDLRFMGSTGAPSVKLTSLDISGS